MTVLETERLTLRRMTAEDAQLILELLNDPTCLRFIGDRGIRTLDDARAYILKGPVDSYERNGFGLYLTALKETGEPIGICGLVKRETLEDIDVGFAFLPQFRANGYGFESASAVMAYARGTLGLRRVVAIVSPENAVSIRLLQRLGLRFEKRIRLAAESAEVDLFAWETSNVQ